MDDPTVNPPIRERLSRVDRCLENSAKLIRRMGHLLNQSTKYINQARQSLYRSRKGISQPPKADDSQAK